VDCDAFLLKKDIATQKAVVDYALWGGIIPETGKDLAGNLKEMRELGAVAYKAFMCWSAREYPPVDDGLLYAAMQELAKYDQLIGLHAENDAMIKYTEAQLHAANRTDPMAHVESRPPEAELEAIRRAMFLARRAGVRLHIVHMSLAEGAEMIKQAKHAGQRMTVETTPQYLVLDSSELERQGPYAKCAPPLRSRENVERLWDYVLDGTIDFIGSDHAPFTFAEKDQGKANIWEAYNGLTGIQEMFSLVISEGVHKRGMPLERVAAFCAANAARTFRLYPKKGAIMLGSDADFILVNLDKEWEIRPEHLYYKNKWTPYAGMKVHGQVEQTIVRGRPVYVQGEVLAEPGYGRFVKPVA
jgi:allantoinase